MTKREYLEARIKDINQNLSKRNLDFSYRKSQTYALAMCKMDLERELMLNEAETENYF